MNVPSCNEDTSCLLANPSPTSRKSNKLEGSDVQHWIELSMGIIATAALAASAFEGLRLWRDWKRSGA